MRHGAGGLATARAMSSVPIPRPLLSPRSGTDTHSSAPCRLRRTSPSKWFGSGTAIVARVPVTSTQPWRFSGESQLSTDVDIGPDSNCASTLTFVGTVTVNSWPALGPTWITRLGRAVRAVATTDASGPKACTSAVR